MRPRILTFQRALCQQVPPPTLAEKLSLTEFTRHLPVRVSEAKPQTSNHILLNNLTEPTSSMLAKLDAWYVLDVPTGLVLSRQSYASAGGRCRFFDRFWDPVPPPTVHDDHGHGGDEQEAQDDATNDEAPVNENFDQQAQAEQVPPTPPPQAPARRSTIE
ncbi:hypothetical protein Ancab_015369 [Ancistrocladus abbreviatus]